MDKILDHFHERTGSPVGTTPLFHPEGAENLIFAEVKPGDPIRRGQAMALKYDLQSESWYWQTDGKPGDVFCIAQKNFKGGIITEKGLLVGRLLKDEYDDFCEAWRNASQSEQDSLRKRLANGFTETLRNGCITCLKSTRGPDENYQYGRVKFKGRSYKLHDVMFTISKGLRPKSLVLRHRCDNPRCCNSDHIVVGTKVDDLLDTYRHGKNMLKSAEQRKRPPASIARGERHGMVKLSDQDVADIRATAAAFPDLELQMTLGRMYDVTQARMGQILRGEDRTEITAACGIPIPMTILSEYLRSNKGANHGNAISITPKVACAFYQQCKNASNDNRIQFLKSFASSNGIHLETARKIANGKHFTVRGLK